MTDLITLHMGEEEGHGHIDICVPGVMEYVARVRHRGERRYTILTRTDSKAHAYRTLADAMADGDWNRGDVLGVEPESYYEPGVLVEMKR
jgi:hypothetical protein